MAPPRSNFLKAQKKRVQQRTLEDVLGKAAFVGSSRSRSRSPVKKTTAPAASSSSPGHDDDEDEDDLPLVRPTRRRAGRAGMAGIHWSDGMGSSPSLRGSGSGSALAASTPSPAQGTSARRLAQRRVLLDSGDDEEEGGEGSDSTLAGAAGLSVGEESGSDSEQDVRPAKRVRRLSRKAALDADAEGVAATPASSPNEEEGEEEAEGAAAAEAAATPPRLPSSPTAVRSVRKSRGRVRSEKQRHMELLRRRRRGEKVTESDLMAEEMMAPLDGDDADKERQAALYDTDPEYVALSEFEDEEGEEEEEEKQEEADVEEDEDDDVVIVAGSSSHRRRKQKASGVDSNNGNNKKKVSTRKPKEVEKRERKQKAEEDWLVKAQERQRYLNRHGDDDDDSDEFYVYNGPEHGGEEEDGSVAVADDDMDDFIDDNEADLIGAPDADMLRQEIPLQFTSQARKPLKSHFKDAVEWLVQRRLNPGGIDRMLSTRSSSTGADKADEVYRVAWDRLDREVTGLAQSRFISSSWTPEFNAALRARPYMDSFDLRPAGGRGPALAAAAAASGGDVCHACGRSNHPTSFRVLFSGPPYHSQSLDEVADDGDDGDIDMHGNPIPPASREWFVGVVCHSNAETAHSLLHWRLALRDWVEEKLKSDGQLTAAKLQKRDRMKPDKRRARANAVVDEWEQSGTIGSLYGDFGRMLDAARAKSTKTTSWYGR